jgi:hypothetical protein
VEWSAMDARIWVGYRSPTCEKYTFEYMATEQVSTERLETIQWIVRTSDREANIIIP